MGRTGNSLFPGPCERATGGRVAILRGNAMGGTAAGESSSICRLLIRQFPFCRRPSRRDGSKRFWSCFLSHLLVKESVRRCKPLAAVRCSSPMKLTRTICTERSRFQLARDDTIGVHTAIRSGAIYDRFL